MSEIPPEISAMIIILIIVITLVLRFHVMSKCGFSCSHRTVNDIAIHREKSMSIELSIDYK